MAPEIESAVVRRSRGLMPASFFSRKPCSEPAGALTCGSTDQIRTAVFAIPSATSSTVAASGEQLVNRADFDAFERQTADTLQSMTAHLDAQQADLKALADQV